MANPASTIPPNRRVGLPGRRASSTPMSATGSQAWI